MLELSIDEKPVLQPNLAVFHFHNPACGHRIDWLVCIAISAAPAIPRFSGFEIKRIDLTAIHASAFVPTLRGCVCVARWTLHATHREVEAIGKIWSQKKARFLR